MKIRWFNKHKNNSVTLGGQSYEPKPLSMESALELLLLLSPYIALIEGRWPEFQAALKNTGGLRGGLLFAFFRTVREDMFALPGDFTKAVALLTGADPVELAKAATAEELIIALPELDKIHNFSALYETAKSIGIVARYKNDGTS